MWRTAQYACRHGKKEKLADISELHIPGFHNAVNSATAAAAAMDAVPAEAMRSVLTTFEGVKHRIQFVKKVRGVSYYNDSIATTPSRTIVCLRSFPAGSILVAAAPDKGIDYIEMLIDLQCALPLYAARYRLFTLAYMFVFAAACVRVEALRNINCDTRFSFCKIYLLIF